MDLPAECVRFYELSLLVSSHVGSFLHDRLLTPPDGPRYGALQIVRS